jgi:hypothetical protein
MIIEVDMREIDTIDMVVSKLTIFSELSYQLNTLWIW